MVAFGVWTFKVPLVSLAPCGPSPQSQTARPFASRDGVSGWIKGSKKRLRLGQTCVPRRATQRQQFEGHTWSALSLFTCTIRILEGSRIQTGTNLPGTSASSIRKATYPGYEKAHNLTYYNLILQGPAAGIKEAVIANIPWVRRPSLC